MMGCHLRLPAMLMLTCCHSTPDHEHQDWGRCHLQDWLRKCMTRPGPATRGVCLGHCPAQGGPSGLRHCQVHRSPVPLLLSCPADVGAKCRSRPCCVALCKHAGSASVTCNDSHGWLGLLLGRERKRDSPPGPLTFSVNISCLIGVTFARVALSTTRYSGKTLII